MEKNKPSAPERVHISFFGRRNAGKSSIINAVTGQDLVIVSDIQGTTTNPIYKTMELLPMGPVILVDTPGTDAEGAMEEMRLRRSYQVLNKTDIALLVIDASEGRRAEDEGLIARFHAREIPYLIVYNKADLLTEIPQGDEHEIWVSATEGLHIFELKERIARLTARDDMKSLVSGLIHPGDLAVLVVAIDAEDPEGKRVLPRQQTIHDILHRDGIAVEVKEGELDRTLHMLREKPRVVITDSRVLDKVAKVTPPDIPLTSFSILFSHYKGNLARQVRGALAINHIKDGDKILMAMGCNYHGPCDDIGTMKIPQWIREYTGKRPEFYFTTGLEFPDDLRDYALVIHCGGCILNNKEMRYRVRVSQADDIPITNYGTMIAYMQGVLRRSVEPFANDRNMRDIFSLL